MANSVIPQPVALPAPAYIDLKLPDGRHSGIRLDLDRGILEVQKQGVRYVFDLATLRDEQRKQQN